MLSPDDLSSLARILNQTDPYKDLSEELRHILLLRGALLSLWQDASDEAVQVLFETAHHAGVESIQEQAVEILTNLAVQGNMLAIDLLYRLFIAMGRKSAAASIEHHKLQPGTPDTRAAYLLLSGQTLDLLSVDPDLRQLTSAYENEGEAVRQKMLASAQRHQLGHWALIVSSILHDCPDNCHELVSRYPAFSPAERTLSLELLEQQAVHGSSGAAGAICSLFVLYDDPNARLIAINNHFVPDPPVDRALFYFLSEQWEEYETLDFNQNLLAAAYEAASPDLRRRLLALSRYSGQSEWLRNLPGGYRSRWLGEMDDADWEVTIARLQEQSQWENLWRLAQAAPAIWAAQMILLLDSANWQPAQPEEAEFFSQLVSAAQACARHPFRIRSARMLRTLSGPVTTLAVSPDGRWLAAGSMDVNIHLWRYPQGTPLLDSLIAPAALTRSIAFSNHGDHMVAASGDDNIRVFRIPESKVIKTFTGHTNLIRALVLHPDQRTLFSAGFDGSLRAWRFPLGTEIKKIEQSKVEIHAIAVSRDGQYVLSAGADHQVKVWKWPEANLVRSIQAHEGSVISLSVSPRGPLAASYGTDRVIRIWNYASGRKLSEIKPPESYGIATSISFHINEQVVITGWDNGAIRFWSVSAGKEVAPSPLIDHTRRISAIALSHHGSRMASSSQDGLICLWDLDGFTWIRKPIAQSTPDMISEIEQYLVEERQLPEETHWLRLTLELARWRQRFEIQLGEIEPIHVGDFDIQL